jgi:DNA-binding Lrp family transcriptional regulator
LVQRKTVKTEPRRQQILKLLEETGTINVNELADRFQVSLVTIRNDLDDLEKEGLLQRTFGGAVFSHRTRFNRSFREGITAKRGHSTPNPDDAQSKEAIMGAVGARLCIVEVAKANLDREAVGPNAEQTPSRDKAKAL